MSLDDLAVIPTVPRRHPRECGVAYAMRVLPADRAAVLERACANPNARHLEIYRNLAVEMPDGADIVTDFSIRRHRSPDHVCGGNGA